MDVEKLFKAHNEALEKIFKVSVIIPIYNVEPYIRRCLDSVINQTYANLEIILVDDGSPDNCPAICDEYATKDQRIVVIHKENGGLSDARNAGLDICKGQFISFIDSDDWVELDYIETLYNLIINNNADISIGNFQQFSTDNRVFQPEPLKTETLTSYEILTRLFSQPNSYTIAWGKLFKKELFNNIRFPVGYIHEDEYTGYKPLCFAKTITCTEKVLYHYLRRTDSITGAELFQDKIDIIEKEASFFHQHGYFNFAHSLLYSLCCEWLKRCRLVKKGKLNLYTFDICLSHFKKEAILLHKNPHKISLKTFLLYLIAQFPKLYFFYYRIISPIRFKKEAIGMVKYKVPPQK